MKKTALALAVTGALGVAAHAATVSEFANGVLVPYATFNGTSQTVAVGLTTCAAGNVFWTFFDQDTKHVTDGVIPMTANDQFAYIWSDPVNSGIGLEGQIGYLTFVLDTGGATQALDTSDIPCLAGNAFDVDTAAKDVAYLPTLPLDASVGDFGPPVAGIYAPNLAGLDENSIQRLEAGAHWGDFIYLRYFIDNAAGGNDTDIFIWSAQDVKGTYTVIMFDDDQNGKSVNLVLPHAELNIVDPETIVGRPNDFLDGFITWQVPTAVDGNGVVSWSYIHSDSFGAVQTVVNPIEKLDALGQDNIHRIRVQGLAPGQPSGQIVYDQDNP